MHKRWRRRAAAGLATIPLALGAVLLAPAAAQAAPPTYQCRDVIPQPAVPMWITAYPCTGPALWSGGGTVLETSTGTLFQCQTLAAAQFPQGLFVNGTVCAEV
jgi:hypothetical protein